MDLRFNADLLREYGVDLTFEQHQANAEKTVIVGMSGGVDSSVVALLMKLQGYRTIGMFMKNWDEINPDGSCNADADYQDVIKVCEDLEIPYYSVNFVEQYAKEVFAEFLRDYREGHTPNPDVLCNREIKFKVFYQRARLLGADYFATGHYCQIDRSRETPRLMKAVDQNKDQTYFLYAIDKEVLHHTLFPIGHLPKPKVRELAERFNLATKTKKDSTGICFIGERNFKNFLSQYIESSKGNFVTTEGKVLGQHDGTCFYTLGQRKGMGIGGPGDAWFVVAKNHAKNEIILAQGDDHPALYADGHTATELNWLVKAPETEFRATAKVRYRQVEQPCTVTISEGKAQVEFDRPQRALTPRQSVVFYQDQICIGGGIIETISPTYFELKKDIPKTTKDPFDSSPSL